MDKIGQPVSSLAQLEVGESDTANGGMDTWHGGLGSKHHLRAAAASRQLLLPHCERRKPAPCGVTPTCENVGLRYPGRNDGFPTQA